MKSLQFMQNIQNIPGATDTDTIIVPDVGHRDEENDDQNGDSQTPIDKFPSAPVREPGDEAPINENPREPVRIM